MKGEKNPDERRNLVAMAAEKWPTRVANMAKHVDKVMNSAPNCIEAADKEQLRTDMLFFYLGAGFKPEEYVGYELNQKTVEECHSFVSFRECCNMFRHMNSYSGMQVLNNKGKTYKRLKPYFQRDAVYVSKRKDYPAFQAFIEKHPTFVKKAVYESWGQGVELIDSTSCGMTGKELFDSFRKKGPVLLEERIKQGNVMAQLNESSVNTVRSITFKT